MTNRKLPLWIALRYIFTKRSFHFITIITSISIVGITVGVAALICVLSIFNGFAEFTQDQLVSFDPHIKISYPNSADSTTIAGQLNMIEEIDGVVAASVVITDRVIAINKNNMNAVSLYAVNVNEFSTVSGIADATAAGVFGLSTSGMTGGIVLGAGLSSSLGTLLGDTISLMTPEMLESQIRTFRMKSGAKAIVTGIFQTNDSKYDNYYCYISDRFYSKFSGSKSTSDIDIRLTDLELTAEVQSKLKTLISSEASLQTWYDLHSDLYNIMRFEKMVAGSVLALIIIIAVFNVLASLSMTVFEKQADIALLKSIGSTKNTIKKIYICEGLMIGFISTVAGVIIGLVLTYGQMHYSWFEMNSNNFIVDSVPVAIAWWQIGLIAVFSVFLSTLSAIYPAHRAAASQIMSTMRKD